MAEFYSLAVLGSPISHSRSPAIHAAALKLAGLKGSYVALETTENELLDRVQSLRAEEFHGFNLTMPLKEKVVPMVDRLTNEAAASGSVNTLRFRDNHIEGHSTDEVAFAQLISRPEFQDRPFLILGSGGSARAAVQAVRSGSVYIAARSSDRAKAVINQMHSAAEVVPWSTPIAGAVVINCTPVGMAGDQLPEGVVDVCSGLIDLPYASGVTPAVRAVESRGLPVCDGYEFLARQAASSFTWWTGVGVDFRPLVEVAKNV